MFIYIDRETSAPDQKHFLPSYTFPSQPILGFSKKKNWHGLIQNNKEFSEVIKKNHVKLTVILVSGLKVSEGCNTIFWSF